jgi:uroporphyrinogen-III decarboxylase
MVPFVSTPAIAQQVVEAVKFPPLGNRGVDGACCVFGNVDAVQVMFEGTRETIQTEVRRQLMLGQQARGFVLCQGSPFTLDTPPSKVTWFVRCARQFTPFNSRSHT